MKRVGRSSIRKSGRPRNFHSLGLPDQSLVCCFYTANPSRLILDQLLSVGLSVFDHTHEIQPCRKSCDRNLESRLIRLERFQHRQSAPKLDLIRIRNALCSQRALVLRRQNTIVRFCQFECHYICGGVREKEEGGAEFPVLEKNRSRLSPLQPPFTRKVKGTAPEPKGNCKNNKLLSLS